MCNGGTILWIGETQAPAVLAQATAGRWDLRVGSPGAVPDSAVLAVLSAGVKDFPTALGVLQQMGVVTVVWGRAASAGDAHIVCVSPEAPAAELTARLDTAATLAPLLRKMHRGVAQAEDLAREASRTAEEIDEEMRLASRLQQDFLPRQLPKVGPVRFAVRYLSASFVSGDIYDVTRLDETHVGFYVADAVGHGMPAALITMFIKKALQTKRISGHTYEIIPPHEALAQLNFDLYRQRLSMCEFCTAAYGIVDVKSLTVTLSRAGHPAPIVIRRDGSLEMLDFPGSLLGILEEAKFESRQVQLAHGDRLLLYSDGVEDLICGKGKHRKGDLVNILTPLADLPREELLSHLTASVPADGASDDITLLLLDVE